MFRTLFALGAVTTAAIGIALVAGVSRASADYIIVPPTTVMVQSDLVVSAVYRDHVIVTNRPDPTYPTMSAGPFWVEVWGTASYGLTTGCYWAAGPYWYWVGGLAPGQSPSSTTAPAGGMGFAPTLMQAPTSRSETRQTTWPTWRAPKGPLSPFVDLTTGIEPPSRPANGARPPAGG